MKPPSKHSLIQIIRIFEYDFEAGLKRLTEYDFDQRPDENGNTSLHFVNDKSHKVIPLLFANNLIPNVNAKNNAGFTALEQMILQSHYLAAVQLLRCGGRFDFQSKELALLQRMVDDHERYLQFQLEFQEELKALEFVTKTFLAQCDIQQKNSENNTLLQKALIAKDTSTANFLIEAGIELNHRNRDGKSALELAAENGSLGLLLFLLNKGADIQTSLQFRFFEIDLNDYDNSSDRSIVFTTPEEVFSFALFTSIKQPREKSLIQVLKALDQFCLTRPQLKNIIMNTYDEEGFTVLHRTIKEGKLIFIRILIAAGADINKASSSGITPLFMTEQTPWVNKIRQEIIKIFIDRACDINQTNENGSTLLLLYAARESNEMIDLLLAAKADVNKCNNDMVSPLQNTSLYGRLSNVEKLLYDGASIVYTTSGHTALHYALEGYSKASEELAKAENENDVIDSYWKNYYIKKTKEIVANFVKLIELLLDAGAGIYVDIPHMPAEVNLNGKILVGLTINSQSIDNTMKGFENAIIGLNQLRKAIKNNVLFVHNKFFKSALENSVPTKNISQSAMLYCRKKLIHVCNARLQNKDEKHHQDLKILKSELYQLPHLSLVNLCLNLLNQPSSVSERLSALHKGSGLPDHLKQELNPDEEIQDQNTIPSP